MDDVAQALAERRTATQERLEGLVREHERIVEASQGDNSDDEHDPEGQTIAWDRAQTEALIAEAREQLTLIEVAERRLADGWDGRCEACGHPIPHERLLARPTTTRCVHCA